MNNLRKTQLAVAMALAAGILSGCQNNSTRADTNERETAETVSVNTTTTAEPQRDNEYSLNEDYPRLEARDQQQNAMQERNDRDVNQSRTQAAANDNNETVLFGFDSADLTDDAKESLDTLASNLKEQEAINAVTIRGYADATGPEEYNEHLSQRRAESVRNYLRDKGIEANTWNVEGLGEESPVASNDNGRGRSENRRVVVEMSSDNQGLSSSYSPD